jgi:hypothetical protein
MAQTVDRQMISRRNILTSLAVTLAAPAIVHYGNLMPVKRILVPDEFYLYLNYEAQAAVRVGLEDLWKLGWHPVALVDDRLKLI